MSHYHDTEDLKALAEFKRLAPAEFQGFVELDSIVGRDDGKIPRKYRELIGSRSRAPRNARTASTCTRATRRRPAPPGRKSSSPRCWRPRLGPGPRPPTERSR